jgi:hypothetical protein
MADDDNEPVSIPAARDPPPRVELLPESQMVTIVRPEFSFSCSIAKRRASLGSTIAVESCREPKELEKRGELNFPSLMEPLAVTRRPAL